MSGIDPPEPGGRAAHDPNEAVEPAGPIDPVGLAEHYRRFRVSERLLLTGHSHQAWPDVGFAAQQQAWLDAAEHVDAKWSRAEEMADRLRRAFTGWLGDDHRGTITLGANTHELLVRLLSALPLRTRPRIVTTDGEFHSARRQFDRLREEGLEVVAVPADPVATLPERLAEAVDERTAMAFASKVLFATGRIVGSLAPLAERCRALDVPLCVDAYHALGAVDWGLADDDLHDAFVVGGGYKYLQLGEGCCFLRWPSDTDLRPVITGWYAEFGDLESTPDSSTVAYGRGPERFAGATYDPTSHYRGAAVTDFFVDQHLDGARLQASYRHQVARLAARFDDLGLDRTVVERDRSLTPEQVGGFLALHSPVAARLQAGLAEAGVHTDARGDVVRFGPAPYLTDDQLDEAMARLGRLLRGR